MYPLNGSNGATQSRLINPATGLPFEFVPQRDYQPTEDEPFDAFAFPHVLSFAGLVQGAWRTYLHDQWDEAMRKSREAAQVLRRDCFLMSLLDERREAVCGLKWHLEVDDEQDPLQKGVKDALQKIVQATPRFNWLRMTLLNADWWGRYAVEARWVWKEVQGRRELHLGGFIPLNGDKIGHTFDHTPYVLINSAYKDRISGAEFMLTTLGWGLLLKSTSWRERFLLHQHDVGEDPDFFDLDTGEMVHGLGLRDRVFFYQWMKLEWVGAVGDWLQRAGLGVNLWHYDLSNPASLTEVRQQAKDFSQKVNIFVPIAPNQKGQYVGGFERIASPMDGVHSLYEVLIPYIDRALERYIVGQSMSGGTDQKDGLGGTGRAKFAEDTKHTKVRLSAENLDETLTGSEEKPGLVSVIHKYSFPETYGQFRVRFKSDLDDPEVKGKVEAVVSLAGIGVEFVKNEVRGLTGMSDPKPGDDTVGGQETLGMGKGGAGKGPDGKPTGPGGKPQDGGAPEGHPSRDKPAGGEEKGGKEDMARTGLPVHYAQAPRPKHLRESEEKSGGNGHWITIGAQAGEDGKKHGGTPVFIENGRITRGHKSLTGMRVGALKEPPRPVAPPPQVAPAPVQPPMGMPPPAPAPAPMPAPEHPRTTWGNQAEQAGFDRQHLHQVAAEVMAHDSAFKKDMTKMLQEARRVSKGLGYGDLRTLAANNARGRRDSSMVRGFDDVAVMMASKYPELIGSDPIDASDRLYDLLVVGNPQPMTEDEAYTQAFDILQDHQRQQQQLGEYAPPAWDTEPTPEDLVPFTRYNFDPGQARDEKGKWTPEERRSHAREKRKRAAEIDRDMNRTDRHISHLTDKVNELSGTLDSALEGDTSAHGRRLVQLNALLQKELSFATAAGLESVRSAVSEFATQLALEATMGRPAGEQRKYRRALRAGRLMLRHTHEALKLRRHWDQLAEEAKHYGLDGEPAQYSGTRSEEAYTRARPDATAHWVTIKGNHVLLDGAGNVLAGPKWMKDKGIGNIQKGMPKKEKSAPTPAKPAKKFGKSKARVKIADVAFSAKGVQEAVYELLGTRDLAEVASLVGAPDDAEVSINRTETPAGPGLTVDIQHPLFTADRIIRTDKDGNLYVKNNNFFMKAGAQGNGLGTDVFGRQVENCREAGIGYIKCHAAKLNPGDPGKPHNGYYTWPRFGYDQPVAVIAQEASEWSDPSQARASSRAAQGIRQHFPAAKSVLDVMGTAEGRAWWKANGCDLGEMKFDLSEGSRSLSTFDAYLAEREKAKPKGASDGGRNPSGAVGGTGPGGSMGQTGPA